MARWPLTIDPLYAFATAVQANRVVAVAITVPSAAASVVTQLMQITWNFAPGTQASYRLKFYDSLGTTLVHDTGIVNSSASSVIFDAAKAGLVRSVTYRVAVFLTLQSGQEGASPDGASARDFTLNAGSANDVAGLAVTAQNGPLPHFALAWTALTLGGGETFDRYHVFRRERDGPSQAWVRIATDLTDRTADVAYLDYSVASGRVYEYTVTARVTTTTATLESDKDGEPNLIANDGFEVDTTGWVAQGSNTIESSDEQSKFGARAGKSVFSNLASFVRFAITLTATEHFFGARLKIPSDYDGTALQLADNGSFAGASGSQGQNFDMAIRDAWQFADFDITIAGGDLTGFLELRENGTLPSVGELVYLDGAFIYVGPRIPSASLTFTPAADPPVYLHRADRPGEFATLNVSRSTVRKIQDLTLNRPWGQNRPVMRFGDQDARTINIEIPEADWAANRSFWDDLEALADSQQDNAAVLVVRWRDQIAFCNVARLDRSDRPLLYTMRLGLQETNFVETV